MDFQQVGNQIIGLKLEFMPQRLKNTAHTIADHDHTLTRLDVQPQEEADELVGRSLGPSLEALKVA